MTATERETPDVSARTSLELARLLCAEPTLSVEEAARELWRGVVEGAAGAHLRNTLRARPARDGGGPAGTKPPAL